MPLQHAGQMHINVDLDNLWIYEGEFGAPASQSYDALFATSLPRMLDIFDRFNVKSTLFVVGKDLERKSCQEFIADAVTRGHEIGNHSYSHPTNLKKMSLSEKEAQIMRCHELIVKHAGVVPAGFRGPGYYVDRDMLEILMRENYFYDSSVLPSVANQVMALHVFLKTGRFTDKVFGLRRFMFASQNPTRIQSRISPAKSLIELPITTAPFLRWPFHTTYLYMFGLRYFKTVAPWIKDRIRTPIYLLHGVDTHDYPAEGILASRVLPLSKSLEFRLQVLESVFETFSDRKFTTNLSAIKELNSVSLPPSRMFPA